MCSLLLTVFQCSLLLRFLIQQTTPKFYFKIDPAVLICAQSLHIVKLFWVQEWGEGEKQIVDFNHFQKFSKKITNIFLSTRMFLNP